MRILKQIITGIFLGGLITPAVMAHSSLPEQASIFQVLTHILSSPDHLLLLLVAVVVFGLGVHYFKKNN